ncbi:MAG: hypothetical protein R6X35_06975, partial [Candidatus Krumholzibacteriia bacterium]
MNGVELLGYVATVLVVGAMLMGSVVRLRVLNMFGAAAFGVYGVLVDSLPLVLTNGIIVVVHAWKLIGLARHRADLAVLPASGPRAPLLRRFLQVHGAEIANSHPDFDLDRVPAPHLAYVMRDAAVAGLFVWTEDKDAVRVHLDYVLPAFRDLSCAMVFLDHQAADWRARGLDRVAAPPRGQILLIFNRNLNPHLQIN